MNLDDICLLEHPKFPNMVCGRPRKRKSGKYTSPWCALHCQRLHWYDKPLWDPIVKIKNKGGCLALVNKVVCGKPVRDNSLYCTGCKHHLDKGGYAGYMKLVNQKPDWKNQEFVDKCYYQYGMVQNDIAIACGYSESCGHVIQVKYPVDTKFWVGHSEKRKAAQKKHNAQIVKLILRGKRWRDEMLNTEYEAPVSHVLEPQVALPDRYLVKCSLAKLKRLWDKHHNVRVVSKLTGLQPRLTQAKLVSHGFAYPKDCTLRNALGVN